MMIDSVINDILTLLGFQFFQYALIGGIISALATSWIGLFLILRHESMISDGIAHTAFGGIALGLLLGINPLITALVVSIIAVLGISYMRKKELAKSDAAIAVMLSLGFSTGLIIISIAGGFNVEIFSYLFGSILTIDNIDLFIVSFLGLASICFFGIFYKELLSITFDEESAKVTGIPVRYFTFTFNLLVAFTIALSIKVIGVILVVALMVLPGLAALQLKRSFRGTMIMTVCFSILSIVIGIFFSAVYNIATSGVIVFFAAGIFLITAVYHKIRYNV
ncbi:ABC transporter [Thermoplasmatales archaeon SM1-50]|nr:MAG: ABC transporter [Thermoplasmatales archaeon SM1-50]